ncbi:MAG TPA: DEAD/DEAH box helicase, partial [Candidatus Acidoferrales bacterium]|nr:DEAD/DEAH box helicase [Candidatus Acidoferrales bacterium]
MRSLLAHRDTCVVMPTGGGKSLCYQLPAAMRPGKTVVVISPLIALMQDQAAQLAQMGIPAALLNSSLT